MTQRRQGKFFVLEEDTNYDSRFDEHQEFLETMEKLEFSKIKTVESNRFSIPFQDIWANPEQTHQVYFVHEPIFNTNYIRISGNSGDEPESIREFGSWFSAYHYTELDVALEEAFEDDDEDEQAQAIFNFAIGFYVYDPRYPSAFEKYIKSPSVKVRLATIRAIGFQLWDECIPILEKVIQEDSHRAVRDYAKEIKRQIQQPNFDPDDLYENPENYPNSLERVTDKAFQILPQLKDDLQVWMKERGMIVIDALELYQYLDEAYGEFKPTESENAPSAKDSDESSEPDTTEKQNESKNTESKALAELQQQLKSDKQKLTELQSQQIEIKQRIENNRKTDLFGRNQGRLDEERDKLIQQIKETKDRIAQNESLNKAEETQTENDSD